MHQLALERNEVVIGAPPSYGGLDVWLRPARHENACNVALGTEIPDPVEYLLSGLLLLFALIKGARKTQSPSADFAIYWKTLWSVSTLGCRSPLLCKLKHASKCLQTSAWPAQ